MMNETSYKPGSAIPDHPGVLAPLRAMGESVLLEEWWTGSHASIQSKRIAPMMGATVADYHEQACDTLRRFESCLAGEDWSMAITYRVLVAGRWFRLFTVESWASALGRSK